MSTRCPLSLEIRLLPARPGYSRAGPNPLDINYPIDPYFACDLILILFLHNVQVLAEMVNLHFLGLMEALLECQSTILAKLMPLWCPVLQAYNITVGR